MRWPAQVALPTAHCEQVSHNKTAVADFERHQRIGLGPEREFGTSGFFVGLTTTPAAPVANGVTRIHLTLQDYRRRCVAIPALCVWACSRREGSNPKPRAIILTWSVRQPHPVGGPGGVPCSQTARGDPRR
jgi:hypothetical protein